RNGSITSDLDHFLSRWKEGSADFVVSLNETNARPAEITTLSDQQAREVIALHANAEVASLIAARQAQKAAQIAVTYGLVTPVSSAMVIGGYTQATVYGSGQSLFESSNTSSE